MFRVGLKAPHSLVSALLSTFKPSEALTNRTISSCFNLTKTSLFPDKYIHFEKLAKNNDYIQSSFYVEKKTRLVTTNK